MSQSQIETAMKDVRLCFATLHPFIFDSTNQGYVKEIITAAPDASKKPGTGQRCSMHYVGTVRFSLLLGLSYFFGFGSLIIFT